MKTMPNDWKSWANVLTLFFFSNRVKMPKPRRPQRLPGPPRGFWNPTGGSLLADTYPGRSGSGHLVVVLLLLHFQELILEEPHLF